MEVQIIGKSASEAVLPPSDHFKLGHPTETLSLMPSVSTLTFKGKGMGGNCYVCALQSKQCSLVVDSDFHCYKWFIFNIKLNWTKLIRRNNA